MVSANVSIDTPCPEYADMEVRSAPVSAALSGTSGMRDAGKDWLPQETGESAAAYKARLQRSVLHGGVSSCIRRVSAKAFSKPVQLNGDETLPEQLQWMASDIDREGNSLTSFARLLYQDAHAYGRSSFLVDYPAQSSTPTRLTEVDQQIRPYFVHVPSAALIGWRWHRSSSGAAILDDIRIRSDAYVSTLDPGDPWGDEMERTVTVYRRTDSDGVVWQKWSKRDSAEAFWLVGEGAMSIPEIPLVTVYFDRTGYLKSKSPVEDLAWLNMAHWQSASDQRNILRVARIPMPYMTGVDHEMAESPTQIGAERVFKSTNPDARFGFVEPQGTAIKSGEDDLRHLEEAMEALGAAPLSRRSGASVTAMGRAIDESGVSTDAQAYAEAVSLALREGYWWAGRWIGYEIPEDFAVSVYSPPAVISSNVEKIQLLQADVGAGRVTKQRYLTEAQANGLYGDDMDPEEESAAAEAEMPDLIGTLSDSEMDNVPGDAGEAEGTGGTGNTNDG